MDGKVVPPDALIARAAGRQHGAISIAQLRGVGVSDDSVRARVLSGRLHRVHRGVYAVGHPALSSKGRCMAAVLAVGRLSHEKSVLDYWGAAVSHRSAVLLWELLQIADSPVDVTVRRGGGRAKHRGIHLHRSRSLGPTQVTLRDGIPVTTPARTIADMREAASANRIGAIPGRELRKAIRQANVIGLSIAEEDAADRTRSDLEQAFLSICRRHRLRRPDVNVRIGQFLVDFLWREERLVVEADSYRYHRGRAAFQDDRGRELELMRLGYGVLRLSEAQIEEAPKDVAEILGAELRARRGS